MRRAPSCSSDDPEGLTPTAPGRYLLADADRDRSPGAPASVVAAPAAWTSRSFRLTGLPEAEPQTRVDVPCPSTRSEGASHAPVVSIPPPPDGDRRRDRRPDRVLGF